MEYDLDEKNRLYSRKSMSTNFPVSLNTLGFDAFSRNTENLCENSCISHMMRLSKFFLSILVVLIVTFILMMHLCKRFYLNFDRMLLSFQGAYKKF